MAAPYNPPKKNEDFLFAIALEDYTTGDIKTNPTIAAGDFTVSKDYGAFANLSTLPDVEPNSTEQVRVQMSSTEMNCDGVFIMWKDQTVPKEWRDGWIFIPTTA